MIIRAYHTGERVRRTGMDLARGTASVLPTSVRAAAARSQFQQRERGERNEGTYRSVGDRN